MIPDIVRMSMSVMFKPVDDRVAAVDQIADIFDAVSPARLATMKRSTASPNVVPRIAAYDANAFAAAFSLLRRARGSTAV